MLPHGPTELHTAAFVGEQDSSRNANEVDLRRSQRTVRQECARFVSFSTSCKQPIRTELGEGIRVADAEAARVDGVVGERRLL